MDGSANYGWRCAQKIGIPYGSAEDGLRQYDELYKLYIGLLPRSKAEFDGKIIDLLDKAGYRDTAIEAGGIYTELLDELATAGKVRTYSKRYKGSEESQLTYLSSTQQINAQVRVSDFITRYGLNRNKFNCYAFAIGTYDKKVWPGSMSIGDVSYSSSSELVARYIESDMKARSRGTYRVKGPNEKIPPHSSMIAIRVGFDENSIWDFHVMRKASNSDHWEFKAGDIGPVMELSNELTPNDVSWDLYDKKWFKDEWYVSKKGFYNGKIIYMIINE
jgi:hypothetical protein